MGPSENQREPQENSIPASADTSSAEVQKSAQSPISSQSPEELKEESRKIRRLQIMMSMVTQVIAQDSSLTVDEASEMVADTRKAALAMFPDKELAFDLIYWPRLQRLMRERYRMQ
ncbi:hypothetical protein P8935_01195 [Telmatobacter sp. DSM 110680]|uniref:Uncharacterized protein n=1 Tax=Telmatobacter sp. DSM 110680 TaxID=3036704 RepID=A0AAU7DJD7_9BACT